MEAGLTLGRCAARGFAPPKGGQSDLGFRCVRLVTLS
ncbi:MAG: hypothetical protein FJ303_26355 [Planctomycetes bacterium]|nr:hypothetical protein [Planctomycetota bacterium]